MSIEETDIRDRFAALNEVIIDIEQELQRRFVVAAAIDTGGAVLTQLAYRRLSGDGEWRLAGRTVDSDKWIKLSEVPRIARYEAVALLPKLLAALKEADNGERARLQCATDTATAFLVMLRSEEENVPDDTVKDKTDAHRPAT